MPRSNKQAILRFRPFFALPGVTVRRRYAAQGCADAHTDAAATGRVGRVGRLSRCGLWLYGRDVAMDRELKIRRNSTLRKQTQIVAIFGNCEKSKHIEVMRV